MTETKFTPGPWRVVEDMNVHVDNNGRPYGDEYIAGLEIMSGDDFIVQSKGFYAGDDDRANANLIAAAPDLYHALDDLVAILELDTRSYVFDAVCSARAALAKARGES